MCHLALALTALPSSAKRLETDRHRGHRHCHSTRDCSCSHLTDQIDDDVVVDVAVAVDWQLSS